MQLIVGILGFLGFFVLPIATIVGLINPKLFKNKSRKKIAGVGFGGSVGVLILAGILLPKELVPQTTNTNEPTVAQIPLTQSEHNKDDTDTNKQPAIQITDNVSQAKSEPKEPATEPKPMASTNDELTKMQQALIGDVPHSFNYKGVVIFKDFADMQEAFNDYTDHKIISADPLKIELYSVVVPTDLPRNITYAQNKAIIYGVYNTFMHTNADKVTIISHLKAYSTDKPANEPVGTPISVTTTKDKALQVLQTHTTAKTFDDLVQLTPHQYRVQGVSLSDMYDEMAKDEIQQAIINDLQK